MTQTAKQPRLRALRIVAIICCLTLTMAIAHGHDLRPPRTVSSPIGSIQTFGFVTLNGRAVQGGDALWNFDLVHCRENSSARIILNELGEVILSSGTIARISIDRHTVIASIVSGNISIRLNNDVEGVVAAPEKIVQTSPGSAFYVAVRDEGTDLRLAKGSVLFETQVIPVKVSIDRQFKARTNAAVTVRVRVTKQTNRATSMASYFQQPDEPIANTPVRFDLNPAMLGVPNPVRVMTDSQGYATTVVTAGSSSGKGKLRATAEESGAYAETDFTVQSGFSSWMKNPGALTAIGAGAAAIIVPAIIAGGENKKITAIGDPVVKP